MRLLHWILFSSTLSVIIAEEPGQEETLPIDDTLDYIIRQYAILTERVAGDENFISTGDPLSSTWNMKPLSDWTVGFYGGSLWMLYQLTHDAYWMDLAKEQAERVRSHESNTGTHDVGFIIMSTFGLGLQMTGNPEYESVIIQAAESLATRYVPNAGVIRSWNSGEPGEVTVIADNMMNLELLLVASNLSYFEPDYTDIVLSHARKTRDHHFRPDGSVYHVVAFDDQDGSVRRKYNVQGHSDESAWSRGLAWVINGFTTVYQNIQKSDQEWILESAEIAASYFIDNLPEDYIPYYDFKVPNETSYVPKDTSAAAIAAHGMLNLFSITAKPTYLETAEGILQSLVSEKYRADGNPMYRLPAIFVNGTVYFHQGDLDTAVVYGDFYFLRALDLYRELLQ